MDSRRNLMPIFVVIVAAMALLPWGLLERWPTPAARAWAFPVLAAVAGLFLLALGRAMTGRWAGILIDRHNTVSLARLQLVLWSLLVLSAFAVGGIANVLGVGTLTAAQLAVLGRSDSSAYAALDIQVPTELLGALGLAGAAAVAGPLIVNTKMQIQPSAQDQQALQQRLGLGAGQVESNGAIFGRTALEDASWWDLFRGDEVGTACTVDLTKVQHFVVTVLLVAAYAGAVMVLFGGPDRIVTLPAMSSGFLWLLTISHASRLGFQTVPQTRNAGPVPAAPMPQPAATPAA